MSQKIIVILPLLVFKVLLNVRLKVFRRLRFSPLSQENGGEKQGDGKNYSPDSLELPIENNASNYLILYLQKYPDFYILLRSS
jgi:hypothetical protein